MPTKTQIKGSPEQEAVWKEILKGTAHLEVDSVAGSGKTFTLTRGVVKIPRTQNVIVMAFNAHIAAEGREKLLTLGAGPNVQFLTYNSFGYRAYRQAFPKCEIDKDKLDRIIQDIVPERSIKYIAGPLARVSRLLKNYLLEPTAANVELVIDKHGFDWSEYTVDQLCDYAPSVLKACLKDTSQIDFDDQIWMTVQMGLAIPVHDTVMIDEAQDTSPMQKKLAMMASGGDGRVIYVGDRHQAIFAFRGADAHSMQDLQETFQKTKRGVKTMRLSYTRRCPKSHVALAQEIVPHIKALDTAPLGEIVEADPMKVADLIKQGDLVLCRVNAPLIGMCYSLIRRGIKATVRGRDIGNGLLSLLKKLKAYDVADLMDKLNDYADKERYRLSSLGRRGEGRLAALEDKVQCMIEITQGLSHIHEVEARIAQIFSDFDDSGAPKSAVVCGTVHRTKGLEAPRVTVLEPNLIPHPMAKQAFELEQERNLAYVAVTRAKYEDKESGTLLFAGKKPPCFAETPESQPVETPKPRRKNGA